MKPQPKPVVKRDTVKTVSLSPKGKVTLKQVDSLNRIGAAKAIGKPYQGKFGSQQSDNIRTLLKKK